MNDDPVGAILSCVDAPVDLYYRLVLVVGPSGSGKTATLRAVAAHAGRAGAESQPGAVPPAARPDRLGSGLLQAAPRCWTS